MKKLFLFLFLFTALVLADDPWYRRLLKDPRSFFQRLFGGRSTVKTTSTKVKAPPKMQDFLCNLLSSNYESFVLKAKQLADQPGKISYVLSCDIKAKNLQRFFQDWSDSFNRQSNLYTINQQLRLPRMIQPSGDQILEKTKMDKAVIEYILSMNREFKEDKYHKVTGLDEIREWHKRDYPAVYIFSYISYIPDELFYDAYTLILKRPYRECIEMLWNSPEYQRLAVKRYKAFSFENALQGLQAVNIFNHSAKILMVESLSVSNSIPMEKIDILYYLLRHKTQLDLAVKYIVEYGEKSGYIMPNKFKADVAEVTKDLFRHLGMKDAQRILDLYL